MNNTFNVNEFNTIFTMIDEHSSRLSKISNEIISLCEQLSSILNSTDSTLSTSYKNIGNTLNTARTKILSLLQKLEEEMKSYQVRTLKNEEEADSSIKEINTSIDEIATIFNNILNKK